MTSSEQSNSLAQLTIDGGVVSHPPPPPRASCPGCGRLVPLYGNGALHSHKADDRYEGKCPYSGKFPRGCSS